jgi:hypothetical protein
LLRVYQVCLLYRRKIGGTARIVVMIAGIAGMIVGTIEETVGTIVGITGMVTIGRR